MGRVVGVCRGMWSWRGGSRVGRRRFRHLSWRRELSVFAIGSHVCDISRRTFHASHLPRAPGPGLRRRGRVRDVGPRDLARAPPFLRIVGHGAAGRDAEGPRRRRDYGRAGDSRGRGVSGRDIGVDGRRGLRALLQLASWVRGRGGRGRRRRMKRMKRGRREGVGVHGRGVMVVLQTAILGGRGSSRPPPSSLEPFAEEPERRAPCLSCSICRSSPARVRNQRANERERGGGGHWSRRVLATRQLARVEGAGTRRDSLPTALAGTLAPASVGGYSSLGGGAVRRRAVCCDCQSTEKAWKKKCWTDVKLVRSRKWFSGDQAEFYTRRTNCLSKQTYFSKENHSGTVFLIL